MIFRSVRPSLCLSLSVLLSLSLSPSLSLFVCLCVYHSVSLSLSVLLSLSVSRSLFPPLFSLNMERQLGSLILATDISQQNEYLSRFRTHLDQDDLCLSHAHHRHFILQVSRTAQQWITLGLVLPCGMIL